MTKIKKESLFCNRCGAKEAVYFYKNKCRRCIGLQAAQEPESHYVQVDKLHLNYDLTEDQKVLSKALVSKVNQGHDVYVEAVCGAGKTEMCLELVKDTLNQGLKIGWAIPRREVVMELHQRLSGIFPNLKVIRVCEGYTDEVFGDLIICTTHQLFRYHQYFDVLIIDEPDAFPYFGNEMLQFIAHNATRANLVYLSATYECDADFEVLQLSSRPSNKPLPLPKVVLWFEVLKALKKWHKESVLVFVPTKKWALRLSILLNCSYITSASTDKHEVLAKFRESKGFLICTTILERGVTFKDCYVIVLFANHRVFNKASLVQIAGRVERGLNPKKGEVLFWGNGREVQECLDYIKYHRKNVLDALATSSLES